MDFDASSGTERLMRIYAEASTSKDWRCCLSQVLNTYWDERIERIGAAEKTNPIVKRRVRARRLLDAVILTIILAAAATCVSVYTRARGELEAAMMKHQAAGEKVDDLTIKVQKLERDVKQLRTDPRVIELFARQRFGFVRAGDVVIKIAQEGERAQATASSQGEPQWIGPGASPASAELERSGLGSRTNREGRITSVGIGVTGVGTGVTGVGTGVKGRITGVEGRATRVDARAVKGPNLTPQQGGVYTDASN